MGLSRTFQNIRLFSQLTVRENVEAATHPGLETAALDEVLTWLGLLHVEREKAVNLPYGMQRRLEIAAGGGPRRLLLTLLDEPAAGMNESESDGLLENIRRSARSWTAPWSSWTTTCRLIDEALRPDPGPRPGPHDRQCEPHGQISEDPAVVAAYLGGPSTKSAVPAGGNDALPDSQRAVALILRRT